MEKCTTVRNDDVNVIYERPNCVKNQPDVSDNDCLANIVGGRAINISDGGNPRISKRMNILRELVEGRRQIMVVTFKNGPRLQALHIQHPRRDFRFEHTGPGARLSCGYEIIVLFGDDNE